MEIHLTFFSSRQTANQLKWILSIAAQAVRANGFCPFIKLDFYFKMNAVDECRKWKCDEK